MEKSKTWPGKNLLVRASPRFAEAMWLLRHVRAFSDEIHGELETLRGRVGELETLRARVGELERAVQENRRLNRRIAELTDVVQELLLPVAQRDEKRLAELLDEYSKKL